MTDFEAAVVQELKVIGAELRGIRIGLEAALLPQAIAAEPSDCPHTIEHRIDFGITNGIDDWQCGVCQFRTVPPTATAEVL